MAYLRQGIGSDNTTCSLWPVINLFQIPFNFEMATRKRKISFTGTSGDSK